jgi:hypothetical protein
LAEATAWARQERNERERTEAEITQLRARLDQFERERAEREQAAGLIALRPLRTPPAISDDDDSSSTDSAVEILFTRKEKQD